jgi:hypothetical protein
MYLGAVIFLVELEDIGGSRGGCGAALQERSVFSYSNASSGTVFISRMIFWGFHFSLRNPMSTLMPPILFFPTCYLPRS